MKLKTLATVMPHHGVPAVIQPGRQMRRDREWQFSAELPDWLVGCPYLDSRARDILSAEVTKPGWVYVATSTIGFGKKKQQILEDMGYTVQAEFPKGTFSPDIARDVVLLGKEAQPGERVRCEAWSLLLCNVDEAYVPMELSDVSMQSPMILHNPVDAQYQSGNQLFQGIPSMAGTDINGRLWATWYGGGTDENEHNWCVLYTSADDGATWQGPKLVIEPEHPFARSYDPNLWTDPDGRLWFIWNQSYFHFDGRCGVWAMHTDNPDAEEPVWSEPKRLADGIAMCDPVVLENGDWLLPTAIWGWGICDEFDKQRHSNVCISRDKGESWEYLGSVNAYESTDSCDENMIIQQRDGSLRMLIRTGAGIEESFSEDGIQWPDSKNAGLTRVVSRFYITRLQSGRQLLVYNDPADGGVLRSHMTAAVSDDDGKTWPYKLVLDERDVVSYPDAWQDKDGNIYIIYDRNRYSDMEILMAKVTEADILAGKLVSDTSRLRIMVNHNE